MVYHDTFLVDELKVINEVPFEGEIVMVYVILRYVHTEVVKEN